MRTKPLYTLALAAAMSLSAWANTDQTVASVSGSVTVPDEVDYHITGTTPFASGSTLELSSTSGSVVILDGVLASKAVNMVGTYVTIDGAKAVNGSNCDVRLYKTGAIIFPYTEKDAPLTVYTEQNFGGTSLSDFGLEDNSGYMNTLTDAKLNNKIRSFKLRRGYMVTFSTKSGGYGYNRCFIADKADLEMSTLPAVLDHRITSYRIFKWTDASKKGLANNTDEATVKLLNATSCYSFGPGGDTGRDIECVRHHIYEGWPSITSMGENGYTTSNPTIKTNNEPGNSADDHPQTVDEVLANWQALMATGKRLCSPSSHDGSLSWLRNFMDSIDARGWRCDVLDMHCYWPEGSFSGLSSWYNSYHRPIWVSEWVWGASWNKNGVFSTGYTDDQAMAENAKVIGRLINNMENWGYVERYFYWNSEAYRSKLVADGALTAAGKVYADLDSKIGFNSSYQYVPTLPKVTEITDFSLSFAPKKLTCTLTWGDSNGDLIDSMVVERRLGNSITSKWQRIGTVDIKETNNATYTYNDVIENAGKYYYRVHSYAYNGKEYYSDEILNAVSGAEGTADVQWGVFSANTTDENYNFFETSFTEKPVIVFGSPSSKETSVRPVEVITSTPKVNSVYSYFASKFFPWDGAEMTETEQSSYLAAKAGNGTLGSLAYEAGIVSDANGKEISLSKDTVQVTFSKPFTEAPVVLVTPQGKNNYYPLTARIWDVTATGFKVILKRQQSMDEKYSGFNASKVGYFAIKKGVATEGNYRYEVGDTTLTFTSTATRQVKFKEVLTEPVFLAQMQTFNRQVDAFIRTGSSGTGNGNCSLRYAIDQTSDNKTVSSSKPVTENIGYFVVSAYSDPSGIEAVSSNQTAQLSLTVKGQTIEVSQSGAGTVSAYDANGTLQAKAQFVDGKAKIALSALQKGVVILKTDNGQTAKVVVGR